MFQFLATHWQAIAIWWSFCGVVLGIFLAFCGGFSRVLRVMPDTATAGAVGLLLQLICGPVWWVLYVAYCSFDPDEWYPNE